jgi:oxygen-independent coproporphyrinogen III oxidase
VHRVQPEDLVRDLVAGAREAGFLSINADLIYGLPEQTVASFARTVDAMAQLRPDRVAVYGYAHLPQRFKPQRRIQPAALPGSADRVAMVSAALRGFQRAGYHHIGMGHFALPADPLAVAKRQGLLHRNFQGYSTQPNADLIGLGVSAIGRLGATYSQNAKTLPEYYDALRLQQFPVVRGLALGRDDLLRRAVVMAIMCQGEVDFQAVESAHLIRFAETFKQELLALQALAAQGWVRLTPGSLEVTPLGWYFVRAIARVFDRYWAADRAREQYSRII